MRTLSRRHFAISVALGAVGVSSLLAGSAVINSFGEAEDMKARYASFPRLRVTDMLPGELVMISVANYPWVLWHRTVEDVEQARMDDEEVFIDNDARVLGVSGLTAKDENRSFGKNGEFLFFSPLCTCGFTLVTWPSFFCHYCTGKYDNSGRIRTQSRARKNLLVYKPLIDEDTGEFILDEEFAWMAERQFNRQYKRRF